MKQTAAGILGAGVFGSVWDAVAQNGTFEKVYPDELLSIEMSFATDAAAARFTARKSADSFCEHLMSV